MGLIKLSIKFGSKDERLIVEIDDHVTVRDLKLKLEELTEMKVDEQRIIHKGRTLNDSGTLLYLNIVNEDTMYLLKKRSSINTNGEMTNNTAIENEKNRIASKNTQNSPLGLNSPFMNQMLNSPIMESLLSNGDLMRNLININPEMKQLFESNPQLQHMFNDPSFLKQTLEAARNPRMQQELMRNQDRAIANIESLPGGYNALRKMYHDVLAPVEQASLNQTSTTSETKTTGNEEQGHKGAPIPNPWANSANNLSKNHMNNYFNSFLESKVNTDTQQLRDSFLLSPLPSDNRAINSNISQNNNNLANDFIKVSHSSRCEVPKTEIYPGPSIYGPNPWTEPTSQSNPEQCWKYQLEILESMGFSDKKANISLLLRYNGVLDDAIEVLLDKIDR